MMADDILNFNEHRRRDGNDDLVRCARCGKMILATAMRCPECGVHFQGQAYEFDKSSERKATGRPIWIMVIAILALLTFVLSIFPR